MQGMGDSSQGFANAIIFVIFTKNIRDSFINCCRCGKKKEAGSSLEAQGQIQHQSNPTSPLNRVSSDSKQGKKTMTSSDSENSHHEEEASLVFGSLGSSLKVEHTDYFQRYGAVN